MPILALLWLSIAACGGAGPAAPAASNTELLLARVEKAPRAQLKSEKLAIEWPGHASDAVGMISSVAAGPDGVCYALHRGLDADPVLAIDAGGRVLRSWGAGLYTIPHSIRVDRDGNVWTVDSGSSQVYKFSAEGEQLLHIDVGEMPERDSAFRGAADIAFASDGSLFIADGYGNARVLVYSAQGERIREWGKKGAGPGEFNLPHAIAIDEHDTVYVGDRENGRIQRFDPQGHYLGEWGGLGRTYSLFLTIDGLWLGAARLDQPTGAPGWLMRLNRQTGEIVELAESPGTHSVTVGADGAVFTGVRPNALLRFRER
jgi:hypothetical protein